jgi:WD40-like Beta Propeller Repeat
LVLEERFVARAWIALAVLAVLWSTATTAAASFPGRNGTIVYGWTIANKYVGSPTSIRTVDPRSRLVRTLRDCPLRTDGWPLSYPDCHVSAPRYSPDGARIAFPTIQYSYPPGEPWVVQPALTVLSADGSLGNERTVPHTFHRLAWSPAGDRFLLQRPLGPGAATSAFGIVLAAPDGVELGSVTPPGTQTPDWSSTGEIAFGRLREPCPPRCGDVYVTRLDGKSRRLTHRGGSEPSWSPRGTKLAFVRVSGSRRDIYIVRRNGRGLRRLTYRGGHSPAWSPDGKWIAFIRRGDIYVVRTNGRDLRRLVDELGPDSSFGLGPQVQSIDWQPLPGG